MKLFILKILAFFSIIVAIDCTVGFSCDYLQTHPKGGDTKILNDLINVDCHDIIVFGSSRAKHHYDADYLSETLGKDVYNAGFDGRGVILSYGLLGLILERYSPRLVIFDVEPMFDIFTYNQDNNNKRYITDLKPYYKNRIIADIFQDISYEEYVKVHSGMMRYNSAIITKVFDSFRNNSDANNGYEPWSGIYTGEMRKRASKEVTDTLKLRYLEKMICLAAEKKVSIIFVASPKYEEVSKDIFSSVKTLCEKNNVPFLNYYSAPEFLLHKDWFKEPMHLNAEGARIFSERLLSDIEGFI